jgi:hypothetical protein
MLENIDSKFAVFWTSKIMDNKRNYVQKARKTYIEFKPRVQQMPLNTLRTKGDQVIGLKETQSKI